MDDPAWISKFLGGLGLTQAAISSWTREAWKHEPRKDIWSNIARLYTYARNQAQPGLVLGDFIQAELIRNCQDPSPRRFLLTCGVNTDGLRRSKARRDVSHFPVRNSMEFFEPLPYDDKASRAYFAPPPGPEVSDSEALGYATQTSPTCDKECILAYIEVEEPVYGWQTIEPQAYDETYERDRYVPPRGSSEQIHSPTNINTGPESTLAKKRAHQDLEDTEDEQTDNDTWNVKGGVKGGVKVDVKIDVKGYVRRKIR